MLQYSIVFSLSRIFAINHGYRNNRNKNEVYSSYLDTIKLRKVTHFDITRTLQRLRKATLRTTERRFSLILLIMYSQLTSDPAISGLNGKKCSLKRTNEELTARLFFYQRLFRGTSLSFSLSLSRNFQKTFIIQWTSASE